MKIFRLISAAIILCSCSRQQIRQIDLSRYFSNYSGTAVFYNPASEQYKIYNLKLAQKRSSPCSTFKIMSSFIAISENLITAENSLKKWNNTPYWNPSWNQDISFPEAFRTSCVWYYRRLIDEIGRSQMQIYLDQYNYGNRDASDWNGRLNSNERLSDLKGFWIESSLLISPQEQTQVLSKIFQNNTLTTQLLESAMLQQKAPVKIYGKTGMGVKNNKVADAWFVGFYKKNYQKIFFAIRLDSAENPDAGNYRNRASLIAKEIAIKIINNETIF